MKRSVRPKLKDDVHLSVFTSSLAFVETPNLLRRVEGDHLELVKEVLLPKLDGTYEVDRIVHDLAGHLDPETVLSIVVPRRVV